MGVFGTRIAENIKRRLLGRLSVVLMGGVFRSGGRRSKLEYFQHLTRWGLRTLRKSTQPRRFYFLGTNKTK